MKGLTLAALLALALPAVADESVPQPISDGWQVEIDGFQFSSAGGFLGPPAIDVGYDLGRNAFLIGVAANETHTSYGASQPQSDLLGVSLSPTYRYYFADELRPGRIIPFGQAELDLNLGSPGPVVTSFGGAVAFGGEYLVTAHLGIGVRAFLSYQSYSSGSLGGLGGLGGYPSPSSGGSFSLGLGGLASLHLHF